MVDPAECPSGGAIDKGSFVKILIYSRAFWPSVGGLETIMQILAEEFTKAGHHVTVVTEISSTGERECNYSVLRSPGLGGLVKALRESDVCLSANVSLRGLGPMLIAGRPVVISHHGVYGSPNQVSLGTVLKNTVTRFSKNICVSRAVQLGIPGGSIVIPNTYDNDTFKEYDDVLRDRDIVFVGRLVSDKGVTDLISALGHLARKGMFPKLTIIGDGPERSVVEKQINELGLSGQIGLAGTKRGRDLAKLVARHRVMAVPSRWAEPFGVAALEGIACGCVVVGTNLGGLPEAIGPCGITVDNGDSEAIARALESLLGNERLRQHYRSGARDHLARHSRSTVSKMYLDVLRSVAA